MGREKDKLIEEQDRTRHLETCLKCGAVLRDWKEREMSTCEGCFERMLEKE
ncbi:hypothetical protein SAMN04488137_1007 [Fictibacillus solisalsi]|uniref:YhfH-like protein n=1 Tax=Fictibacillus solisalsi TaxID=459525 RepID=A0A1G9UM65_9BACL|nr:hypothetical protein [Fictibacillus solisalsi]SDM60934.1 hypothetical protein SAMN04488137_1007 [Fictibacillus solisalsi]